VAVQQAEADLARLDEEAGQLRRRLAEIEAEARQIRVYLEMRARYESTEPSVNPVANSQQFAMPPTSDPPRVPSGLSPESPYYGKSIAEAAAILLKQAGRPMTENEIFEGLRDAGVPFVSVNPVVNLRMAMRRRPDLVVQAGGRWEWVAPSDAASKPVDTGCVPNRSREVHMAKTWEGLAAAKARGVIGGRRPTVTTEIMEEVRRLTAPVSEGGEGLSMTAAAKRLGVGKSTIYRFIESEQKPPH